MQRVVVADLEADGFLDKATTVWCGAFKDIKTKELVTFDPRDKNYIQKMLSFLDSIDVLIMHNGIYYDLPLLNKLYGYEFKGKVVDTLWMSRLQNPKRKVPYNCPNKTCGPHSVEAWGYRLGRGKPEHNDWSRFSEDMLHRCIEDTEIQFLIYKYLLKEDKDTDWIRAHKLTFKLFTILQKQSNYGWKVDVEYLKRCIPMLTRWIEKIDRAVCPMLPKVLEVKEQKEKGEYKYVKKLFLINGNPSKSLDTVLNHPDNTLTASDFGGCFSRIHFRTVDINSNKEVKDYLLAQGWVPDAWNYKKDKANRNILDEKGMPIPTSPKLSYKDNFVGVSGSLGRLVAKRVQCKHRRSIMEGWLDNIREDNSISASVADIADTSRMKHRGIVNVPNVEAFFGKQMRKCFIARGGMVLVGCDSAGCQNRMLAARVGDDFFTNTLINGKKENKTSIHHVNQRAIKEVAGFDVTYGQAKTLNYAFMFGASDKKLGATLGKSKDAGTLIRKALLSVAAGFEDLVAKLTKEWRGNAKKKLNPWGKPSYYNGWVRGLDGRKVFISSEHQILVYVLQSDEAIMMSCAYCLLFNRLNARGYKWGRDYGIVCFYHDEYTIECRKEIAKDVAKIAEKCIVDAGKHFKIACPHAGEACIGDNWYDIH